MKFLILLPFLCVAVSARMAYQFASGIEDILGAPTESFSCDGRPYGYYADVDNDCKVFHVCVPITNEAGETTTTAHFSFFCGNETIFNQESLTCTTPENSLPCQDAASLYDLVNSEFGRIPDDLAK